RGTRETGGAAMRHLFGIGMVGVLLLGLSNERSQSADAASPKWLSATAYVVPKETATEGEGYFALIEGLNQRLYIGTHANGINSWLVEFDPSAAKMNIVVDAHKAITVKCSGFAAQSKIHTRNNTGASGRIYFGTKQGYPTQDESRLAYP